MPKGEKENEESLFPMTHLPIRTVEKPPYVIDESRYKRFDERNTVFSRVRWDKTCIGYGRSIEERMLEILAQRKPGYSRVDYALYSASWTVNETYKGAFSWEKLDGVGRDKRDYPGERTGSSLASLGKYRVKDPAKMSRQIKRVAKFFGASLVGICELDRRWVYSHTRSGNPVRIPEGFKYAVVMAVEMDPVGIGTSPAVPAAVATGNGYSRMAFTIACLGEFIRGLGYKAIQMGNDTALSIPLAVDAGLGQLGRNGLLITPEFGPRVRLCKVFTDLPLKPDKPIDFGVTEYCKKCRKCAEACEVRAISDEVEPSFEGVCLSNNPGVLKWYVNGELCYNFWCDNGADCSTCITVCPFNVRSGGKTRKPAEFWKSPL
ncbi:MAG: reductive dehalogenase [Candidatus Bathyarchaeia archaeon]